MTGTVPTRLSAAIALGVMVALALLVPVDHDESQYVAAASLVARGLIPYRDFAYLQTPLQPYFVAPLAWLAPGWLLVAARIVNAAAMAGAAWLVGRTAIRLSGVAIAGPLGVAAVIASDAVQFGGSVARNDALPMLMFAGALACWFGSERVSARRAFFGGLLVALAASTKISYALPAAAAGTMALWHARAGDRRGVAALLGGLALGALPTVLFLALATRQFLFDAVHYSVDAVRAWQALNGTGERLDWLFKAKRLVGLMAMGPLLVLLVAVAARWRSPTPRPLGLSLGGLLLAALVASALPSPTYRQYLVPVVAPLVLLAAARRAGIAAWLRAHRGLAGIAGVIMAGCLVAGVSRSVTAVIKAPPHERPIAVARAAHRIGELAARAGTIGGLDPLLLVDSGLALDPRFATGPFLFRAGNLAACADETLCPLTYAHPEWLDRAPPRFLVSGSERVLPAALPGGLDGVIDRWASRQGYTATPLGHGRILWRAPQ